jgi:hypothetical protein
MPLLEI